MSGTCAFGGCVCVWPPGITHVCACAVRLVFVGSFRGVDASTLVVDGKCSETRSRGVGLWHLQHRWCSRLKSRNQITTWQGWYLPIHQPMASIQSLPKRSVIQPHQPDAACLLQMSYLRCCHFCLRDVLTHVMTHSSILKVQSSRLLCKKTDCVYCCDVYCCLVNCRWG